MQQLLEKNKQTITNKQLRHNICKKALNNCAM